MNLEQKTKLENKLPSWVLVLWVIMILGLYGIGSWYVIIYGDLLYIKRKYTITDGSGSIFHTDKYEIKDKCIYFINARDRKTIICGTYTIE
jgi:hypothetical protein